LIGDKVTSVAFSPNNQVLASSTSYSYVILSGCEEKGIIYLWDLSVGLQWDIDPFPSSRNYDEKKHHYHHEEYDSDLAQHIISISPNSKSRVLYDTKHSTEYEDYTIPILDIDGKLLRSLTGHNDNIVSIAFSPDSQLLASSSYDKTVRLWDVASGQQLQVFELSQLFTDDIYKTVFHFVSFTPDGRLLNISSSDGNTNWLTHWWIHPYLPYDLNSYDTSLSATEVEQWLHLKLHNNLEVTSVEELPQFMSDDDLDDLDDYDYNLDDDLEKIMSAHTSTEVIDLASFTIQWSPHNPLHWLPKAQAGDAEAMLQLGIRYFYGGPNQHHNARLWFTKAQAAGQTKATWYLNILDNTTPSST